MAHHTDSRCGIAYATRGSTETSRAKRHLTFIVSASNYGHAHKSVSSMEPWRAKLDESDSVAAWDLFIEQYRRLIFATIKQLARDHDDILDVFTRVCEALRADNLARLRRYTDSAGERARFSTWLVTVVHNQAIDWFRHRDGRPRPKSSAKSLSNSEADLRACDQRPLARRDVRDDQRGRLFANAIRRVSQGSEQDVSRLRGFTTHHRAIQSPLGLSRLTTLRCPGVDPSSAGGSEGANRSSAGVTSFRRPVGGAASSVVDEMPAAEVARAVGWRNAKAVYNRVYRALGIIREGFEKKGIRREDL